MKRQTQRRQADPVISLINVVFLILIFFMVAGTLTSTSTKGLSFVQTENLECCIAPDALTISSIGEMTYQGKGVATVQSFIDMQTDLDAGTVSILPDRELPAVDLLVIIGKTK